MKKLVFLLLKLNFSPSKLNAPQAFGLNCPAEKCTKKNLDSMNWIVTFSMPRGLTIDCNMSFNWRVFDLILVEMGIGKQNDMS